MLDFTFLFVIFLIVLAVQSNQPVIAIALLVLLVLTSKSKYLTAAALLGGGIALAFYYGLRDPIIIGVGFIAVIILIVKSDPAGGEVGPQGYFPGGGM